MSDSSPLDWTDLLPRIRKVVSRLAAAQDVDDLTQECCVRVIGAERLWEPEKDTRGGWVRTIARNLSFNHRTRRRPEAPLTTEPPGSPRPEPMLSEERISWLLEQFRRLPPDGRDLLRQHYFEDRSLTEIAEELGVSQPTVSRRLAATIKGLQRRAHAQGFLSTVLPTSLAGTLAGASKMKLTAAAVVIAAGGIYACAGFFTPSPDTHLVSDTSLLKHTRFAATPVSPLRSDENLAWCATMPVAWEELTKALGETPRFSATVPTAAALERYRFDRRALAENTLVAGAGRIGDGIVDSLQEEVERTFGRGRDPVLDAFAAGFPDEAILTYSFLARDLRFRYAFDVLDEAPLKWRGPGTGGEELAISAFGIRKVDLGIPRHKRLVQQVHVERYESPEDFIIRLLGKSGGPEIVIARMKPEATLAATIALAQERMAEEDPGKLTHEDRLAIPKLDFHVTHRFSEFDGPRVINGPLPNQPLVMIQSIRLKLDETGAELRSRTMGALGAIVLPRHFVADGPFLLLMREADRKDPYLAVWVAHPELLIPIPPR